MNRPRVENSSSQGVPERLARLLLGAEFANFVTGLAAGGMLVSAILHEDLLHWAAGFMFVGRGLENAWRRTK